MHHLYYCRYRPILVNVMRFMWILCRMMYLRRFICVRDGGKIVGIRIMRLLGCVDCIRVLGIMKVRWRSLLKSGRIIGEVPKIGRLWLRSSSIMLKIRQHNTCYRKPYKHPKPNNKK